MKTIKFHMMELFTSDRVGWGKDNYVLRSQAMS